MKTVIEAYFRKLKLYPNYYANEDFSKICNEIKRELDDGVFLLERMEKTDISIFEKEFGYQIPMEIVMEKEQKKL